MHWKSISRISLFLGFYTLRLESILRCRLISKFKSSRKKCKTWSLMTNLHLSSWKTNQEPTTTRLWCRRILSNCWAVFNFSFRQKMEEFREQCVIDGKLLGKFHVYNLTLSHRGWGGSIKDWGTQGPGVQWKTLSSLEREWYWNEWIGSSEARSSEGIWIKLEWTRKTTSG